jgi:6-phosphofructokinase 1
VNIGILTSGGDCPGLNAAIRAVVRASETSAHSTVVGFRNGYKGVMESEWELLSVERCRGILPRGGTILGTSRETPFQREGGVEAVARTCEQLALDGFVVVGGNGSLSCAEELHRAGIPIIGIPKTIDNDIVGTDVTIGFDTACHVASTAIDRLHTTAEAHDRVLVVEVMGRNAGHIAVRAGLAGGAAITLIPEVPFDLDEVCEGIVRRHERGGYASIVCVAEGAMPAEGTFRAPEYVTDVYGHQRLGGISTLIAPEIEQRTGFETRVTILGHVQRGGTPTAYDRQLATRLGVAAVEAAVHGEWGHMIAYRNEEPKLVPLEKVAGRVKTVTPALYDVARLFWP